MSLVDYSLSMSDGTQIIIMYVNIEFHTDEFGCLPCSRQECTCNAFYSGSELSLLTASHTVWSDTIVMV